MEKLSQQFVKLVKDCGFEIEDWRDDLLPDFGYFARIISNFTYSPNKVPKMAEKIRKLFTLENYNKFTEEFHYFDVGTSNINMITIDYAGKAEHRNTFAILHTGKHRTNRNVIMFGDAECEISDRQSAKCYDYSKLRVVNKGNYSYWKSLFDSSTGYAMGRRFKAYDNALVYSRGCDLEVGSSNVIVMCELANSHYIHLYNEADPQVIYTPGADVHVRG